MTLERRISLNTFCSGLTGICAVMGLLAAGWAAIVHGDYAKAAYFMGLAVYLNNLADWYGRKADALIEQARKAGQA